MKFRSIPVPDTVRKNPIKTAIGVPSALISLGILGTAARNEYLNSRKPRFRRDKKKTDDDLSQEIEEHQGARAVGMPE